MLLTDHLEELRRRALVVIVCLFVFSCVGFYFAQDILRWLKYPAGGLIGPLTVFSPTAAILTFFKISMAFGFIFSLPVLLCELWGFIRPALSDRWSRIGFLFIFGGTLLFLTGALFCFFVLVPASLKFLLSIGRGELQFIISLEAYTSFVLTLTLAGGIVFEMPLAVFVLAKVGILTASRMIRAWRIALVAILVGAAILTPTPDVVNMILMAIPMILLYLVSVGVAHVAARRR
ncbi:MAG: twin arginine-targeting protein translocase TatC [Candidatus Omnitrophica bacterium CG1_02_49_16]|nr:MAG: twin arginine-targeting protein translocase TatC [Candidatus Omnitrophica bacterium CG1_02_49_16]